MISAPELIRTVQEAARVEATILGTERFLNDMPFDSRVRQIISATESLGTPSFRLGFVPITPSGIIGRTPLAKLSNVQSLAQALAWCAARPPAEAAAPAPDADLSSFYLDALLSAVKTSVPVGAVLFNLCTDEARSIANLSVDRLTAQVFKQHYKIAFRFRGSKQAHGHQVCQYLFEVLTANGKLKSQQRRIEAKLDQILFPQPTFCAPPIFHLMDNKVIEMLTELLAHLNISVPTGGRLLMLTRQCSVASAEASIRREQRGRHGRFDFGTTRVTLHRMTAMTRSIVSELIGQNYDAADLIVVFLTAALVSAQRHRLDLRWAGLWITLIEKQLKLFLNDWAPSPGAIVRREDCRFVQNRAHIVRREPFPLRTITNIGS